VYLFLDIHLIYELKSIEFIRITISPRCSYYSMKKSKSQYRKEALARVRKLNLKKTKSKFFSKLSTGNYLVRMIKQERNAK